MCAFPCFLQDLQKMLMLVCLEGYNWEILVSPVSQKKLFIIGFEDLLSDLPAQPSPTYALIYMGHKLSSHSNT